MVKKLFLFVMLAVMFCSSCAFADDNVKVGILTMLNITPEEFSAGVAGAREAGKIKIFKLAETKGNIVFSFYDSLNTLQMALNKGDVDEISLPEPVGEYMLNTNSEYEVAAIVKTEPVSLSFGFRKSDDSGMRDKFNEALRSMREDGTLAIIVSKFITEPGTDKPEPINFIRYDNAKTVKVAVTGDLPPVDYVAADGTAEGFNIAILAEIARRLHINVELVHVDAEARAASLASGRSDIVFWFQWVKGYKNGDATDEIVLSESYFSWDEILHIKRK